MKTLVRLEEGAQFAACLVALIAQAVPWWMYLVLLIGPDIGMLGYLVNTRVGAFTYNLLHHKGVAVLVLLVAFAGVPALLLMRGNALSHGLVLAGIVLFGHSSLDRALGYGLKFGDHFQHTHLGWIGKMRGRKE